MPNSQGIESRNREKFSADLFPSDICDMPKERKEEQAVIKR